MFKVSPTLTIPSIQGTLNFKKQKTWDSHLGRELSEAGNLIATRLNAMLPRDGSEPMEGDLDLGGFALINGGAATFSSLHVTGAVDFDTTLNVDGATTIGGQLIISGAGAGQIVFPATQNPSANANTLDDYEEGTFTPTVFGSTTAGVTTYTGQTGNYVKIGKTVLLNIEVSWSAQTGTGSIVIGGLPFTSAATVPLTMYGSSLTFGAQVGSRIVSGNATMSIITFASGGAVTNLAMDTSALVGINGTHIV